MDDYTETLPFPIAGPCRLLRMESQPSSGVFRIFDVLEMVVRYSCACVACELRDAGEPKVLYDWTQRPLSLGAMTSWLQKPIQRTSFPSDSFSARLASIWRELHPNLQRLIAERNRTRGHGLTVSERKYMKLRGDLEPYLNDILLTFQGLADFRPIIIKGMNDFDGNQHEYQVLVATGENPYFPVEALKTERSLPFRRVYLWDAQNTIVPLHPFLAFHFCDNCDEEHLLMFQSLNGPRFQYIDPLKGCHFTIEPEEDPAGTGGARRQSDRKVTVNNSTEEREISREPAIGMMLDSRYLLHRELGRGAGGRVFLGVDQTTGSAVAIKILIIPSSDQGRQENPENPIASKPELVVKRFQREVRVLSHLRHPALARILDVGVSGGLHYFVSELVEGEELAALVRRGPLPVPRALEIVSQLCDVLSLVHGTGIVHRDLKPSNVMVQPDGQIKLLDFGVARWQGTTTITGADQLVGTAGYMAPEQIGGRPVDVRADLFSLGVILYELLTGRKPFDAPTFDETLTRILKAEPVPPAKLDSTLPAWLTEVTMHLLAKQPSDRPASAEEVSLLLRQEKRPENEVTRRLFAFCRQRTDSPSLDHPWPIEVKDLEMSFGRRKKVLRNLSLQVPRGTRYCLLGRNGAGKSTLIQCMMGMLIPQAGQVRLLGTQRRDRRELNKHVGYVPETPTAPPFLRLGQFLSFLSGLYPTWDQQLALGIAAQWGLNPETKIGSMSRGMQTIVSLLAALGHRPRLLILDDPTLGLDAFWSEGFLDVLTRSNAVRKTTMLFSTHSFTTVETLADRVGFLDEGRICRELDIQDLPRRFCYVSFVLPDDEEPQAMPRSFTQLGRNKRTVEGIFEIDRSEPRDAFAPLRPVSFDIRPASLKNVYFHVLGRHVPIRAERAD